MTIYVWMKICLLNFDLCVKTNLVYILAAYCEIIFYLTKTIVKIVVLNKVIPETLIIAKSWITNDRFIFCRKNYALLAAFASSLSQNYVTIKKSN